MKILILTLCAVVILFALVGIIALALVAFSDDRDEPSTLEGRDPANFPPA